VPQLIFLLLLVISSNTWAEQRQVAIIIDDIGYRQSDRAALNLPGSVTYSVLPHTPYGKELAQQAFDENRDVMLHIPMEAENGKKLGPGALTSEMNEQGIRASLASAFDEIPFAVGINNHMGSKLTKQYSPMAWTMRYLKEKNVFFLDSLTTRNSKVENIADHFGVQSLHRHLFLDNDLSPEYITKQFMELIRHAKIYNSVIAIAHPHPETIKVLTELIPMLAEQDIQLVPISKLLPTVDKVEEVAVVTD